MDDIDRAQRQEEHTREDALRAHRRRTVPEQQLVLAGEVICVTCFEAIEPRRLDAMPDAVRCTQCQDDFERHGCSR